MHSIRDDDLLRLQLLFLRNFLLQEVFRLVHLPHQLGNVGDGDVVPLCDGGIWLLADEDSVEDVDYVLPRQLLPILLPTMSGNLLLVEAHCLL